MTLHFIMFMIINIVIIISFFFDDDIYDICSITYFELDEVIMLRSFYKTNGYEKSSKKM